MNKKILILDDEKDFTEIMGTMLKFHGFTMDTLNNPVAVRETIQTNRYDLIVTDLMMPEMDGFKIVETIRGLENYKKTPIIVLSAKTLTDQERKMLMKNEVRFLSKPFDPEGLVDTINQLLGGS